jgi:hypothetical protein
MIFNKANTGYQQAPRSGPGGRRHRERIVQCLTGKSSIETITIRIVLLGPVQARRRLFGRRETFIATDVLKYTALKGLTARSYPMGML